MDYFSLDKNITGWCATAYTGSGLAASKSKNLYMVLDFYVLSGTNTARSDTEMR